jgi:hypothetical protein
MTNMLALSLLLAATPSSPPDQSAQALASQVRLRSFRAVAQIAAETCTAPQMVGWTLNAKGSAVVSFAPAKLITRLIALGGKLGLEGSYDRWSGPLQRDVGLALAARSTCQRTVFVAMVNRLPLADPATGRPITKPQRPLAIFRQVQASATPAAAAEISNGGGNFGQQINATAPSTNYATGGPVSNGAGPAIQNIYFGAAVTADQKQEARDALLVNLRELAAYPERGAVEPAGTIVQRLFRFHAPQALYLLLAKYDRDTIAALPGGADLNVYEHDYYDFERSSIDYETAVINHVGTLVAAKYPDAWRQYYGYALRRAGGISAEAVATADGQLTFGITPEDEERIYKLLNADATYGRGLKQSGANIGQMTDRASALLARYAK